MKGQELDLLVSRQVIVELKAIRNMSDVAVVETLLT
ncbi:MAG: GxxExxY protein [Planctomycetota bacterium]